MPLQRLELYNFKSYKGLQAIEFGDAPFMCIIGPNGAGKSNSMDAVSFVSGVKSAQSRSTQLRDSIYRGRKALEEGDSFETQESDPETAHVMAVYIDDTGKEWKFKRSISSSGQSSYYSNSRESTYKAYNAQLEKFNILVKAKNFLVFQGDVESVASQDSKDLSKSIDRISGSSDSIAQYEQAKQDFDRTAEASATNYNKKRSMQSEARLFREQKEEIERWESSNNQKDAMIQRHLLWRLFHLTNEINESARKVEEANERSSDLQTSVDQDDQALRDGKRAAAQAALAVKRSENVVHKAQRSYEDKKPELVTIETQIAHSKHKAEESQRVAERVQKDLDRQEASLRDLEQGAADVTRQMNAAAEKQRQRAAASGKVLSQDDLDEYHRLRSEANTRLVTERQQVDGLKRARNAQRIAIVSLEDKLQQAEQRKLRSTEEMGHLEMRADVATSRCDGMNEERERIKAKSDQAQAERERISIKETELNEKLQDTYAKLLSAGADRRESERETRSREVSSSLKRVFPGVHGRVVDLCKPTSRKYETAVTTILGRNLDAIVVEHEKVAIDCIDFMRNQRAGQATFIPLDTIQVRPVQEKYRNFAKGARLAIDCIEYEPAVERAMQHACGSSSICDSIAVAKHICYDRNQEVKAVTSEGTVIHKSGLITGGTGGSSRRFNDNDVLNLQNARDTYMKQSAELHKAKPDADDHVLNTLRRSDAELSIARDELESTQLRLRGLRGELGHIDQQIDQVKPESDQQRDVIASTERRLEELQIRLDAEDDEVFASFCGKIGVANIRDYEGVQMQMAREESEAMEKFTAQQARINHQIQFERSQSDATRERLLSLQNRTERGRSNVNQLIERKRIIEDELSSLERDVNDKRQALAEAKKAHEEIVNQVDALRDAARRTQRSLDRALKEISGWNDEIDKFASDRHAIYRKCRSEEIDLPLKRGRLDKVPLEEVTQSLSMDVEDSDIPRPRVPEDFGIEPDFDMLEEEDENGDEAVGRDYEEQIARMKAELEKMAPNMKAIDRLADVEANSDTAEREAEDTRRENRSAKERFQELRRRRCDLFNKAYTHMSGCIDKVYKDLTKSTTFQTGGVAFLSLEDAEEPYLSGVKYNVMPPGKAFVDMEQSSGGEKTMAALASSFAIHSFHPAPFFVLDEVDAASDPTNVAKLARYVRSQAEKQVQFSIISLKATLYEHADGLVGVYREQEANTSKSLTLDLRQYAD